MQMADFARKFLVLAALGAAASGEPASARYDFVVLADSAGPVVTTSGLAPSIDEDGSVAFWAMVDGVQHILVAREPGATSAEDYESLVSGGNYSTVGAFVAGRAAYTAPAPSTMDPMSSIHRTDTALPLYTGLDFDVRRVPPPLNVLGQTVILETYPEGRVVATDGVDTQVIAVPGQAFGDGSRKYGYVGFPPPDIDGVGRVAYRVDLLPIDQQADPVPCNNKILLSGLLPPIEISEGGVFDEDHCPFASAGIGVHIPIALNDAGSAAFDAWFSTPSGWVKGIFVDRTVWWDARSPGFEGITAIVSFALNDEALLAYVLLDAVYQPILFTGRAPNHERVLGVGDTLCGDTVSGFKFHRYGLNDAGEMALAVQLADQRKLVVRVEPTDLPNDRCITQVPEANAWLAALAALAALSLCRRA